MTQPQSHREAGVVRPKTSKCIIRLVERHYGFERDTNLCTCLLMLMQWFLSRAQYEDVINQTNLACDSCWPVVQLWAG